MHYVPYKNEEMQGLSLQLHREIPESLNAACICLYSLTVSSLILWAYYP